MTGGIHRLAVRPGAIAAVVALLLGGQLALSGQSAVQRLDGTSTDALSITATVEDLMKRGNVPGLAVAIFNRNDVAFQRAFGVRNRDTGEPLTADTVFNAASFTKIEFTYAVMQLVDEKRLDLDTPVLRSHRSPDARTGLRSPRHDPHQHGMARRCGIRHRRWPRRAGTRAGAESPADARRRRLDDNDAQ